MYNIINIKVNICECRYYTRATLEVKRLNNNYWRYSTKHRIKHR